jgi:D-alanyl-D-alanine carboxypeptidase/D-alanyl-D-alanine-endopeptidase (penicillin-binding protein 4)
MPIAGVDGTLRARMKGTPAAGNVRAKTGTLSGVTSLSGYVTSASGERLVFALLVNNFPRDWDARVNYTDRIAVLLASFAGKS